MMSERYKNKRVTIAGLGRTAMALAELLHREGAAVFVSEFGAEGAVAESAARLRALGIPFECGGHTEARFRECDLVVPSPGVSPAIPPIALAREHGAALAGELECAWPFVACPILAVTGTNGKTTTTELLAALLRSMGHDVVLAGNNAVPLSQAVLDGGTPAYMVLEVSSYQLETASTFQPAAATVLNVTPDHLARHGSLEAYSAAKARIFMNQDTSDGAVLNFDDPIVRKMADAVAARVVPFSLKTPVENGLHFNGESYRLADTVLADASDVRLRGRHNAQNVLAALAMVHAAGLDASGCRPGLRAFTGVAHRIEFIADIGGVAYYNDSKATNVDSLAMALASFEEPVVLIAGGQGKGAGYGMLRDLVQRHVKHLITIGDDAPLLEQTFGDIVPVERADSMNDATGRAASYAQAGDVVLLSPACASFDMYRNFEERGRDFTACVTRLKEKMTV